MQLIAVIRDYILSLPKSDRLILPFVPKWVKLGFILIIALNVQSFPFAWHVRLWKHAVWTYWQVWTKGRKGFLDEYRRKVEKMPNLRDVRATQSRMVFVDDCDYNFHLSNSCYAKNGDAVRMQYCIDSFGPVFTPGVYIAMGASHYIFFKEIPFLSNYTMEASVVGWGEKWMYVLTEFIIHPKKSKKSRTIGAPPANADTKAEVPALAVPNLASSSGTSSEGPSGTNTPQNGPAGAVKKAFYDAPPVRADGGVVCCITMHEYCFKIGRVTVPPRIAMYFAQRSPSPQAKDHARDLLLKSKDRGVKWLRGGWKEEPNADELGKDVGGEWAEVGRENMERVLSGMSATWSS
ncbi:hypothetical protein M231_04864 [Tremella mesenterica]|uniref:Thioesterase n=1 Tax=Tremella mesenterica TaxID=5217 RepID=A0A4Q1BJN8_TREME|nr:hypothetical protein M231_04864 [Tremella mesenterica]